MDPKRHYFHGQSSMWKCGGRKLFTHPPEDNEKKEER